MITSINLASSPFMGSCDSTRAQMAAKQIAQALTHENCQIPYVISNEYNIITENSPSSGVLIAQYDGTIIYKGSDLLIIYYTTIDKLEIKYIPTLKKTTGIYASKLRYCINKPEFKKGEILYYYDCFIEGIPTYGYNTFCGYLVNFGFNHEDSLVVSDSFAKKAKHRYIETVYIPIFEYTMMKPLYINDKNSFIYFPNIGQHIKDHLICSKIQPKISDVSQYNNIKTRMMILLNTMNISDLMNIENKSSQFDIDEIKTEIKNATLSGFKIHKLKKDSVLIDTKLQETLEQMYLLYANNYIIDLYKELSSKFTDNFTNQVLRKYLMYSENDFTLNKKDIKDCTYLIELEITKEAECQIGDKYCNR